MRKSLAALTATALAAVLAPAALTSTAEAASRAPAVGFKGAAFGSRVNGLDGVASSGPTALSVISCTRRTGLTQSNDVDHADLGPAGRTGEVVSSARTTETSRARALVTRAAVSDVDLLGGLVTAEAVTARSVARIRVGGATSGAQRSVLTGLRIGGQPVDAEVPPNTRVDLALPGVGDLGHVVLNERVRRNNDGVFRVTTRALVVHIDEENPLGLPVGSSIVVGSASSALEKTRWSYPAGQGYSTRLSVADDAVGSGRTALAFIPCLGGTHTADLAGVDIAGLLSTGTTRTVATGSPAGDRVSATVTNTTAAPDVLDGLISADSVVARTRAVRAAPGAPLRLRDLSGFVDLRVEGQPRIDSAVEPNTQVELPELGLVTFRKTTRTPRINRIRVVMIHIELGRQIDDLPAGTILEIGVSTSRLRR